MGQRYLAMLAPFVYPAYHQHRTECYAPESAFDSVRGLAVVEQAPVIILFKKRFVRFYVVLRPLPPISILHAGALGSLQQRFIANG